MTDGGSARRPPAPATESRSASLDTETEFARLSRRPGDSVVARADLQRDETVRRWGLVTPSATRIGRAESPEGDLSESVRRLHEERIPAMEGYSEHTLTASKSSGSPRAV